MSKQKPPAQHVQAAISAAAQLKSSRTAGQAELARHVQAAINVAAQPKSSAGPAQPLRRAPHVGVAIDGAHPSRCWPLKSEHVRPSVNPKVGLGTLQAKHLNSSDTRFSQPTSRIPAVPHSRESPQARHLGNPPAGVAPAISAPPLPSATGVLQPLRLGKRNHWRAVMINQALKAAQYRTNASAIECFVFHNSKKIKHMSARIYANERFVMTNYAHIRQNSRDVESRSNDGEIHILAEMENFLPRYIENLREGTNNSNYWSDPSLPQSRRHEIEIELIGPQGSCGDCEKALQRFVDSMTISHGSTESGVPINYRVLIRYLNPDPIIWKNRGEDRSGRYGNKKAIRTTEFAFRKKFDPETHTLHLIKANRREGNQPLRLTKKIRKRNRR